MRDQKAGVLRFENKKRWHQMGMQQQCSLRNTTTIILVRDPWSRLMSAYRSKLMGTPVHLGSDTERVSAYIGRNVSHLPPLCRYLNFIAYQSAVVGYATASKTINSHFMPQTANCLHSTARNWFRDAIKCVAIDKNGIDEFSALLGFNENSILFSQLMAGQYSSQSGDYYHRSLFLNERCDITPRLASDLDKFLDPDCAALLSICGIKYEPPRLSQRNATSVFANGTFLLH